MAGGLAGRTHDQREIGLVSATGSRDFEIIATVAHRRAGNLVLASWMTRTTF